MAPNNATGPNGSGATPINIKPTDNVIAVMGITGSGKSTFISHFSDKRPVIKRTLESCTNTVDIFRCFDNDIGEFYLVDTPGFDDTHRSDAEILLDITAWLNEAYRGNILLTGIIYLHRIMDNRIGGVAFRNLRMFKRLCGEPSLSKVVLATTFWRSVTVPVGNNRETELKTNPEFWGTMIRQGAKVFRQDNDRASAKQIIEHLIRRRPPGTPGMTLAVTDAMVNHGQTLEQTEAGQEMNAQILNLQIEYEAKLTQLREDLRNALAKNDRTWQAEIKKERQEADKKIQQFENDRKKLQADHDELKHRVDAAQGSFTHEYSRREALLEGLREELRLMRLENADAEEKQKLKDEVQVVKNNLEMLKWKIRQAQSCTIM
jgi:50S ribosome-binding GTPase